MALSIFSVAVNDSGKGKVGMRFLPFLLAGLLIIACYLHFFVDVCMHSSEFTREVEKKLKSLGRLT